MGTVSLALRASRVDTSARQRAVGSAHGAKPVKTGPAVASGVMGGRRTAGPAPREDRSRDARKRHVSGQSQM